MNDWIVRPLDEVYTAIFIDAVVVKVRDGQVANRPINAAIGVTLAGEKDSGYHLSSDACPQPDPRGVSLIAPQSRSTHMVSDIRGTSEPRGLERSPTERSMAP